MAQWSRSDRTLYAKVVYYGPALGGKTTNLQALHRITDPDGTQQVVSLNTADDRTLFFDLLPFDLGNILGYKVAMKLYTVPGQVRYDATRRVVLAGADAVVFVADSRRGREQENRSSFENLRMNMRANRLDPASLPVLFQFNKQDLEDRATPAEMASWFGIDEAQGFPSAATTGLGVLDTFVAACKAMLDRLMALADPHTRRELDPAELARQVDRAFAPFRGRGRLDPAAGPTTGEGSGTLVLEGRDLLDDALETSLQLGGDLVHQRGRAARLEREAEALRSLSTSMLEIGASFERSAIVRTALAAARGVLGAAVTSLVLAGPDGTAAEAVDGRPREPLLASASGRDLLGRMLSAGSTCSVEDLEDEAGGEDAALDGLGALVSVPLQAGHPALFLAYAASGERPFSEADLRFLSTLAGHLAVGLDKARVHAELARSRDTLEDLVQERTRALRRAYEELRQLDEMKDRFLSGLSHEMRTPLTGIVSAATFLRDYEGRPEERAEMAAAILQASAELEGLLEHLFRVARLRKSGDTLRRAPVSAADVVAEAVRLADAGNAEIVVHPRVGSLEIDPERIARALANLLDNAAKFSAPGAPVALQAMPCALGCDGRTRPGVAFSVLDRGPGIPEDERERIFEPFEQGGEALTGKPDGVGLGLFEARLIARRHGGTLKHLPRPDGGNEFRLVIPCGPAEAATAREAARV